MKSRTKSNSKKNKQPTERDLMKMEIAKELGLWEQIQREGWESLTNEACGRVGGLMNKRIKQAKDPNQS